VDDVVATYRWLLAGQASAGDIVIAGDSAGGGLALAALLALRERALPLPAGAVGIGPWVDLTVDVVGDDPVVTAAGLRRAAANYLGGADPRDPLASPLFGDLRGLPPILVQVASDEALAGDGRRFADKAAHAGVDVSLEEWEGMVHGWHQYAAFLPEAVEAIDHISGFVSKRTAR
jgi:acetyl esterase/lipase